MSGQPPVLKGHKQKAQVPVWLSELLAILRDRLSEVSAGASPHLLGSLPLAASVVSGQSFWKPKGTKVTLSD
jgi:hypothetical protein